MGTLNITHKIGEDKSFSVAIRKKKTGDGGSGLQYPITGTLYFWICSAVSDADALIEKTTGSGITVHYANGGFASIEVDAADLVTAGITTDSSLKCSLWEDNGSGKKIPLDDGDYSVVEVFEDFS